MAHYHTKKVSLEVNPYINYDVSLALKILKSYADTDELTKRDCHALGVDGLHDILGPVLNDDGVVSAAERQHMRDAGLPSKFIWTLAGSRAGDRARRMRMRHLVHDLRSMDPKTRAEAIKELGEYGTLAREAIPAIERELAEARDNIEQYREHWPTVVGDLYGSGNDVSPGMVPALFFVTCVLSPYEMVRGIQNSVYRTTMDSADASAIKREAERAIDKIQK